MNTTTNTESEILSTRTTFDGVTVYLHADGSVSTRMWFFRGKFATSTMWRAWGDIETFTVEEIPSYMRAVKRGELRWQRPAVKRSASAGWLGTSDRLRQIRAHMEVCRAYRCTTCGGR